MRRNIPLDILSTKHIKAKSFKQTKHNNNLKKHQKFLSKETINIMFTLHSRTDIIEYGTD